MVLDACDLVFFFFTPFLDGNQGETITVMMTEMVITTKT
jgi:hypothetical protein